jgi:hypothetical protein
VRELRFLCHVVECRRQQLRQHLCSSAGAQAVGLRACETPQVVRVGSNKGRGPCVTVYTHRAPHLGVHGRQLSHAPRRNQRLPPVCHTRLAGRRGRSRGRVVPPEHSSATAPRGVIPRSERAMGTRSGPSHACSTGAQTRREKGGRKEGGRGGSDTWLWPGFQRSR